jgi:transcriptional regulator of acetoin/glycerol metabolism
MSTTPRAIETERADIEAALEAASGNVIEAAALLGWTARNTYRKLHRHGIDASAYRAARQSAET